MLHYADVYFIAQSHVIRRHALLLRDTMQFRKQTLHCTDFTYIAQHRGCPGCAALLLDDTAQFRKRTLHLQELYSSARAEPKLVKMLSE